MVEQQAAWLGWYRIMGGQWRAGCQSFSQYHGEIACWQTIVKIARDHASVSRKPVSIVVLECPETPTSGGWLKK